LSSFSFNEGIESGGKTITNSNIGATVEVSNFENFSLGTNGYPIITIIAITLVYILGVVVLRDKDKLLKTIT
jgi:hypothetical protein